MGGMSSSVTLTCYDMRERDPKAGELVGLTVQECIWICVVAMRAYSTGRPSARGSSADRACRTREGVRLRRRMGPCGALSPVVQGSSAGYHRWGARGMGW